MSFAHAGVPLVSVVFVRVDVAVAGGEFQRDIGAEIKGFFETDFVSELFAVPIVGDLRETDNRGVFVPVEQIERAGNTEEDFVLAIEFRAVHSLSAFAIVPARELVAEIERNRFADGDFRADLNRTFIGNSVSAAFVVRRGHPEEVRIRREADVRRLRNEIFQRNRRLHVFVDDALTGGNVAAFEIELGADNEILIRCRSSGFLSECGNAESGDRESGDDFFH